MTTVAWDGRYLAADTREVWDKSVPTYCRKIYILSPDIVMAYMGSSFVHKEICDYFLGQVDKLSKEARSSEAILLLQNQPFLWSGTPLNGAVPIHVPPNASGSGGKYAWAYMKQGDNAMTAIKKAADMDIWTNNVIDYYDTKTKKLYLSKFPEPNR